ncbi:MAG: adenosylcobinamide-GDP ribazoletransferase [Bacillota bacterium]
MPRLACVQQTWEELLTAVSMLTILPVPCREHLLVNSPRWFGLVGAVMGTFLGFGLRLASLALPPQLASAMIVLLDGVLTGGMHLDGLADTFDGLGVHGDRLRALEAMRDSRIGATGAAGLGVHLLVKWASLQSLMGLAPALWVMLPAVAWAVGRFCAAWCMYRYPYARSGNGLGKPFSRTVPLGSVIWCGVLWAGYLCALGVIVALGQPTSQKAVMLKLWGPCAAALVTGASCSLWFVGLVARRIGGVTGDVYGAVVELGCVGALIGGIAVAWLAGRT